MVKPPILDHWLMCEQRLRQSHSNSSFENTGLWQLSRAEHKVRLHSSRHETQWRAKTFNMGVFNQWDRYGCTTSWSSYSWHQRTLRVKTCLHVKFKAVWVCRFVNTVKNEQNKRSKCHEWEHARTYFSIYIKISCSVLMSISVFYWTKMSLIALL